MNSKWITGLLITIIFFISAICGVLIFKVFNKNDKIGYEYVEKTFDERTNSLENIEYTENEVLNANSKSENFYILRNLDGYIGIYEINENNNEILIEKTNIAITYLTETDKYSLNKGINVFGKENLNKVLEDFE